MIGATAVFLPLAFVVDALDAGLLWLWAAIAAWMAARLVAMVWRFRDGRWAVLGATR